VHLPTSFFNDKREDYKDIQHHPHLLFNIENTVAYLGGEEATNHDNIH